MSSIVASNCPMIVIPDDFPGYPIELFCVSNSIKEDLESVLIPGGMIHDRIEMLACNIAADHKYEPFTVLCVLKGGYQFFGELLDKLRQLYRFTSFAETIKPSPFSSANDSLSNGSSSSSSSSSTVHQHAGNFAQRIDIEFIRLKSYVNDNTTGAVTTIGLETLRSLKGKRVLVVEDIIDTGLSMHHLVQLLKESEVAEFRIASLFVKRNPVNTFIPDYAGFELPNKFVVGFNLDYNEYFRDLNHVCVISEKGKLKYAS
ncbi:hypoxanthine-guanine phosphoribosyltransferase-like [Panonychus citri]|uniref:hypoxanthine-guanine phosphoribosyltransferase-like n=1 Tax=Panonychus citri TaxID=50023 RepID=UPI00230829A8|nr:hypoxanthine-guanine phosphoribosyltransferase-like [Panonychus citri]